MSAFGKTWWGQQWLQSLNNIDYSNTETVRFIEVILFLKSRSESCAGKMGEIPPHILEFSHPILKN